MAVNIGTIGANATLQAIVTSVNNVVNAFATVAVTANTSANGSMTTGNAYVVGTLGASVLTTASLRGGTINSSTELPINSNVNLSNTSNFYCGNSLVNSSQITSDNINGKNYNFGNNLISIVFGNASVSNTAIDTFSKNSFRSVEYVLSIKSPTSNSFQSSKISVLNDGTNIYSTEYGQLYSNNVLGIFSTYMNANQVVLAFSPSSANVVINGLRTSITV